MEHRSSENVLLIVVCALINKIPTFRSQKFKNSSLMNFELEGHMVNIEPKIENQNFPRVFQTTEKS